MSDPFERVKGGRLTFKGGTLATRSKTIDKKKKKKNKKNKHNDETLDDPSNLEHEAEASSVSAAAAAGGAGEPQTYTIDAAKRMKYEQLFPVEAKKFGYEPKPNLKSVEDALDDRVKKKADRYCK